MTGYAPDGESLSVSPDGKDWHIRLTRADKNRCDEFGQYHGRTVTADDMRRFLPNWASLDWQPSRKGIGPSKEIAASDGEFRVSLVTMEACTLPEEQVVGEFRQFMADSE